MSEANKTREDEKANGERRATSNERSEERKEEEEKGERSEDKCRLTTQRSETGTRSLFCPLDRTLTWTQSFGAEGSWVFGGAQESKP